MLAGVGLACAAVEAGAETLVIRVSGPSADRYRPGQSLSGDEVALKAADTMTVLDGQGTRTLRGPGTFRVRLGGVRVDGTTLGALTSPRTARARVGAVRGKGEAGGAPNIWAIDLAKGGVHCIADPATLTLWRANAAAEARYTLRGAAGSADILFPAGTATVRWPATLPVKDGLVYSLSGGGLATALPIRLALLPSAPDGMETLAKALIDRDCAAQIDTLIAITAQPGER